MNRLETGKTNFGCFVNIASPSLIEMIGYCGFDFIVMDMEHGNYDWSALENGVRACDAAGVPAVVRIPSHSRECIAKVFDSGAAGIQVPMVDSGEMAREIVQLSKYPPLGSRGVSYSPRASFWGNRADKPVYLKERNEDSRIIVHIENEEGVRNIDEILAVDGIDVVFLGPTDLAVSMGYVDPSHKDIVGIIQKVKDKTIAKNKCAGIIVNHADELPAYRSEGYQYILTTVQAIFNPESKRWIQRLS